MTPGRTNYAETRKRREILLAQAFKSFEKPLQVYDLKVLATESLLEQYGVFRTFFNMKTHEFIVPPETEIARRLYECTGYSFKEFNIRSLNNDIHEALAIVYEKDIDHFVRYNDIVYELLVDPEVPIRPYRDTYTCRFRIMRKGEKQPVRVHRETELLVADLFGDQELVQMDTWRMVHHEHGMNYVSLDFGTPAHAAVLARFYELNFRSLFGGASVDAYLEKRDFALIKDLSRKLSNGQIARKRKVKPATIHRSTGRMLKKLARITKYAHRELHGRDRLVETCCRCGLLPVPQRTWTATEGPVPVLKVGQVSPELNGAP